MSSVKYKIKSLTLSSGLSFISMILLGEVLPLKDNQKFNIFLLQISKLLFDVNSEKR
jgi:hypothetical protein